MKYRAGLALACVALVAVLFQACSGGDESGPTSPTFTTTPSPVDNSTPTPVSPVSPTTTGDSVRGREACGLDLKANTFRAKMDASNNITAFIGADYTGPGDLIVYLWDPEVNQGKQYGPFPINKEFVFHVSEKREYDFRVAGEVDLDGDGKADNNCQDDRYRLKVVPPPPVCEGPKCDPPVCNEDTLASEARQECGEDPFILDLKTCSFECEPPPPCDAEQLKLDAEVKANAECTFGVEKLTLDIKACTFDFTCKEPTCEDDPPPARGVTKGEVKISENDGGTWNAEAWVEYDIGGAPGEYKIEIIWRNGRSRTVKKETVVRNECGGRKSGSLHWESLRKECTHGHVNPDARYFQKILYRETPQDSWSVVEDEALIGQGSATCRPKVCDIPRGGPFPQQGNPRDECSFFGDFVPVDSDPDFYLCKAGTELFASSAPFPGRTCPNGKEISHITQCACEASPE